MRRAVVAIAALLTSACAGFDLGQKTCADRPPPQAPPSRSQWPAQRPPVDLDADAHADADVHADAGSPLLTIRADERARADAAMQARCPGGFAMEDVDYRDTTTCSRPQYPLPRRTLLPGPRCEPTQDVVIRYRCKRPAER